MDCSFAAGRVATFAGGAGGGGGGGGGGATTGGCAVTGCRGRLLPVPSIPMRFPQSGAAKIKEGRIPRAHKTPLLIIQQRGSRLRPLSRPNRSPGITGGWTPSGPAQRRLARVAAA
ncbi:hypothetical protein D7Y04_20335 [Corallococcus sp. AB038B]|nr:hypothetical protein D7Y04_20335 [Corallococcus sp. AB038B]